MRMKLLHARNEEGQAVIEYVLIVAVVVLAFIMVTGALNQLKVGEALLRPLREDFARTYKYGHPKAKGFDEGNPERHPRFSGGGEQNFRIFINPKER